MQLLNLLEVIIDSAECKPSLSDKSGAAIEQPSAPQNSSSDSKTNMEVGSASSGVAASSSVAIDSSKTMAPGANNECDAQSVLLNLPQAELRLLCSFLAREGYDVVLDMWSILCVLLYTCISLFINFFLLFCYSYGILCFLPIHLLSLSMFLL